MAGYDVVSQRTLAQLQLAADDLPGAAYSVTKALKDKPDDLGAMALKAEVDTRQGRLAEADSQIAQILARAPKQAVGHRLAGDLAAARRKPAEALAAYRKALDLQPSSDAFARVFSAQQALDPAAALALAGAWIKAHPDDVGARKLLAVHYERSGQLDAAREQYEQARRLTPNDVWVLNNLANLMFRQQDAQALVVAELALKRAPENPAVLDTVGWIVLKAGQVERALQLLSDAHQRSPQDGEIRYHLADALARSGRQSEAREMLEAVLEDKLAFNGRDDAAALLQSLR
jgi:Tfp pilus assembly protein PilF